MDAVKKFIYYLRYDRKQLLVSMLTRLSFLFPDKLYLKMLFRLRMGYKLNLDNPQTFSEKLQWLKLYNRKPEYTQMVDKYEAKKYVAGIIGGEYIIPTLGVWDSVDDINFDALPNQFVLKTTHGGGNTGVVICRDKSTFDISAAKKKLKLSLKTDIYRLLCEWPYKNVQKRIIAERYISIPGNEDLPDYKFYCFNGEPKYCQVIADRNSVMTIDFYDNDWTHQPFHGRKGFPFSKAKQPKPIKFHEMWEFAAKLSAGIPFLRVDFYEVEGSVYFGELTFFPTSGIGGFNPKEWDYKLGSLIKLPIS